MDQSWTKHFERSEFLGSIVESSNHVRVSGTFGEPPVSAQARTDVDWSLIVPHQGLAINGWADHVAATVFAGALNRYGIDHMERRAFPLSRSSSLPTIRHGRPARSAAALRAGGYAAVALPFSAILFGANTYDPIYEAAEEVGLPIVAHFSGVEGRYARCCSARRRHSLQRLLATGAAAAAGGVQHRQPGFRGARSSVSRTFASCSPGSASAGCLPCSGGWIVSGRPSAMTCRGSAGHRASTSSNRSGSPPTLFGRRR